MCHDQAIEPPLGSPIWGVQRRYKNNAIDNGDFVQSMTNVVK
jgi:hypothetical protein